MRIIYWSSDVCSSDLPHDRPFALLYQFKAPHGNWQPAPRFAKAFEDMEMPEPPTLYEDLAGRPRAARKADMQKIGRASCRDKVGSTGRSWLWPEHEKKHITC